MNEWLSGNNTNSLTEFLSWKFRFRDTRDLAKKNCKGEGRKIKYVERIWTRGNKSDEGVGNRRGKVSDNVRRRPRVRKLGPEEAIYHSQTFLLFAGKGKWMGVNEETRGNWVTPFDAKRENSFLMDERCRRHSVLRPCVPETSLRLFCLRSLTEEAGMSREGARTLLHTCHSVLFSVPKKSFPYAHF